MKSRTPLTRRKNSIRVFLTITVGLQQGLATAYVTLGIKNDVKNVLKPRL